MNNAETFLDWIAGEPNANHTFQLIPVKGGMPTVKHGTFGELEDELQRYNDSGYGVFACINQTDGRGRKTENIVKVRTLVVDLDGAPLDPLLEADIPPHMVVESSPGRWHAYYRVESCPLELFSPFQKALAAAFDGDPSVHDLPRVMRVPGFHHRKRDRVTGRVSEPYLTHILSVDQDATCTVEELQDGLMLSVLESHPAEVHEGSTSNVVLGTVFGDGHRTNALTRQAGRLVGRKMEDEQALAALRGWNAQHCNPPLPDEKITRTYRSIKRCEERKEAKIPLIIDELNRQYAVVPVGGKTVVLRESKGRVDFMGASDFRLLYGNRSAEGKELGHYWLSHPQRRTYMEIVFDPGRTSANDDSFNLWRGLSVEPKQGDCGLYLQHTRDNICSGNEAHYKYLLDWMAHLVQFPAQLPGVAIILKGEQGTGKGVFITNFGSLFGSHFRHITSREHFLGRFNGHLQDAILVFPDEVFWGGNKEQEGVLKTLITEPRRQYEHKQKGVIELDNFTRVMMATNSAWAVPAGMEERRFFVLEVGRAQRQNSAYFSALQAQMENGGREALLYELLHRDISDVDIRAFPRTAALAEQKELSLPSVERWWLDVLDEGAIGPCDSAGNLQPVQVFSMGGGHWPVFAATGALYDFYLQHVKKTGGRYPSAQAIFAKTLRRLANLSQTRPVINGRRVKGYVFPTLVEARRQFEQLMGQPRDWGEESEEEAE